MKKIYKILSFALLMFIAGQNMAQVHIVNGPIHSDTTWTDTVIVTNHIYVPDTVTLSVQPGTYVYFDGRYCIDIDGSIHANGAMNDSITIEGNGTNFASLSHTGWQGIQFNSPTSNDSSFISYCRFFYIYSYDEDTAAIYVNDFSKLIVENCRFSFNYNGSEASCIQIENQSLMLIRNNVFTYNNSYYSCIQLGCASYGPDPTIDGNIFKYNYGGDEGSCLKISAYSNALVTNNIFQYNNCDGYGGAIVISGYSHPTLIGNLIANNNAYSNGGGIAIKYYTDPKLINNTIAYNYSDNNGGGISVGCYTNNPLFQNNIIWGNEAYYDGQQMYCYDGGTNNYVFANNLVEGGFSNIYFYYPFSGNETNTLSAYPEFDDTLNGAAYTLKCISPAIDAGTTPYYTTSTDLNGNPRVSNIIDLGAYEKIVTPVFLTQPNNAQVLTGNVATISFTSIESTDFEWFESTDLGTTWTAISDNSVYSGTTTNTLLINADYTMNGFMYRCEVGGPCTGYSLSTNAAVLIVDYNVGISEENNDIMVYPNPATENFFIQGAEGADLIISDMNGRVIANYYNLASDKEMISLSDFENGIYIMRIIRENNTSIMKIIKE